jgi:hypothetical protein
VIGIALSNGINCEINFFPLYMLMEMYLHPEMLFKN